MLVQKALESGPFSMRQLADDAGLKYATLRAYAMGRRTPSGDTIRRLAAGLRRRAARLQELADELEHAAEEP